MMMIDNKYEIGEIVYLKTDPDQHGRMVFAIELYKGGELLYKLIMGTMVSAHYGFELSKERDSIKMLT